MSTATLIKLQRLCIRCHHAIPAAPAADLGFGYSREPDTTAEQAEPVPLGVELHFFTGRTPRRTAV
ncbi:hypothetical protein [Couchioplanes caeruleus]|uniref:Uncharacterized protein n=2 Tax=Couchioplanes caeruleus TaxID=56438 RepID=A0A1K0GE28_9ACTN|nr:hypothetical protein [Couchioplanes caeruleus]OJF10398.1 hypothetical protein BG844_32205 [Couchioplanes caeruleus subsp. caeruleus]ROP29786.1 hypothetical protein EDD30_2601 [Couchioplanes caeruleus]